LSNAINAVAGGGQIIAFPMAMAVGLSPITANTTNSASLFPGALATAWSFRREIYVRRVTVAWLLFPSLAGAVLGATILRHTPARMFAAIVPWLLFGATLMIMLQDKAAKHLQRAAVRRPKRALAAATQFAVSVYGGFFGVGMGIMMLATLSLADSMDLHQRVAVKSALGASINIAASGLFLAYGLIDLHAGLIMTIGAIIGGTVGGALARQASPAFLRRVVTAIGFSLGGVMAWRQLLA
jgi:uncharacterized membrane protein YfcA